MSNHPNRNKRSYSFEVPVFADHAQTETHIGRAKTAEDALLIYAEYYKNSGKSVKRAVKLRHVSGVPGPEHGWLPQFAEPEAPS